MRFALRILCAIILGFNISVNAQSAKPIEFDHIFDGAFSPKGIQQVRWMNDGKFYTASDGQKITQFNILKIIFFVL